jgi:hypothetical protein
MKSPRSCSHRQLELATEMIMDEKLSEAQCMSTILPSPETTTIHHSPPLAHPATPATPPPGGLGYCGAHTQTSRSEVPGAWAWAWAWACSDSETQFDLKPQISLPFSFDHCCLTMCILFSPSGASALLC